MAKKNSKPAKKSQKATGTKTARKKAPAKKDKAVEIELDAAETKAIELVDSSEKVCEDLEKAVTSAVFEAVCKVFKKNRISLTATQAERVAMVLFSD